MHLMLALLLASAPADAPTAEEAGVVEVLTAVLERPDHSFVTMGAGLCTEKSVAQARSAELRGCRAFIAKVRANPEVVAVIPAWAWIIAGVSLTVGVVLGGYVTHRVCVAAPGLCR